jgi:hypothetical protein
VEESVGVAGEVISGDCAGVSEAEGESVEVGVALETGVGEADEVDVGAGVTVDV